MRVCGNEIQSYWESHQTRWWKQEQFSIPEKFCPPPIEEIGIFPDKKTLEIQIFFCTNQMYLLSPLKWDGHLDFQTFLTLSKEIHIFFTNQSYLLCGHLDFQTFFYLIDGNPSFWYWSKVSPQSFEVRRGFGFPDFFIVELGFPAFWWVKCWPPLWGEGNFIWNSPIMGMT